MAYTTPDPPRYAYEPRRARRLRERQEFEALTARASDLVNSPDPLGVAKAQQLLTAHSSQDRLAARRDTRTKTIGERVRELAEAKIAERKRGTSIVGGSIAAVGAAGALAAGLMDEDVRGAAAAVGRGVLTGLDRARQASLGFFTGDNPIESAQQAVRGARGQERYSGEDVGFVRHLPEGSTARKVGGVIGEELTDPLTLASAVVGGPAVSGALKSAGPAGRVVESVLSPALRGSIARRYAGEAAINLGARAASEGARAGTEALGGGETAQTVAGLAAGLAGGVTTAVGLQAALRTGSRATAGASRAVSDAADRVRPLARELAVGETGSIRWDRGYRFEEEDVAPVLEELARFKPADDVTRSAINDLKDLGKVGRLTAPSARLSDAIDRVYFQSAWDAEGNQLTVPRGRAVPARNMQSPQQRATAKAAAEGTKIGQERYAQAQQLVEQQPELKGMVQAGPEGVRGPNELEAARARMRTVHGKNIDEYIRADAPDERALDRALFSMEAKVPKVSDAIVGQGRRQEATAARAARVRADLEQLRTQYQADRALVEGTTPDTAGLELAGPEEVRRQTDAMRAQFRENEAAAQARSAVPPSPPATIQRFGRGWQITRGDESYPGVFKTKREAEAQAARWMAAVDERLGRTRPAAADAQANIRVPGTAESATAPEGTNQLEDFLARHADEPMVRGRMKRSLAQKRRVLTDRESMTETVMTRQELIERDVAEGAQLVTRNGEVRLQRPDGSWAVGATDTAAGREYADYLITQRDAQANISAPGAAEAATAPAAAVDHTAELGRLGARYHRIMEGAKTADATRRVERIQQQMEPLYEAQIDAAAARVSEPAWTLSPTQYQAQAGIARPHIMEIGPDQIRRQSAKQRVEYAGQRSVAWSLSERIKNRHAREVYEAYQRGEFTLDDPRLHPEARAQLQADERRITQATKQAAADELMGQNRIAETDTLAVGDRVYDLMRSRYGTVEKVFQKSVRLSYEDGAKPATVRKGALQWQSYNDAKAAAAAGTSPRPANYIDELPAEQLDKYADDAMGPETPTGGYEGYPPEDAPTTHVLPAGRQKTAAGNLYRTQAVLARIEEAGARPTWKSVREAVKFENEAGAHLKLERHPKGGYSLQGTGLSGFSGVWTATTPAGVLDQMRQEAQEYLGFSARVARQEGEPFPVTRAQDLEIGTRLDQEHLARMQARYGVAPGHERVIPEITDEVGAQRAGIPQDLRQDVELLADDTAWREAVTTPGARVSGTASNGEPFEGTVIRSDTLPSGTGRVLVEHTFEGQPAQRFYSAVQLEPAAATPDATVAPDAIPATFAEGPRALPPGARPELLEAGAAPAQLPPPATSAAGPSSSGGGPLVPTSPPGGLSGGGAGAPPGGSPPGGGPTAPPPGHAPLGTTAADQALARENRVLKRPGQAGQLALKNPIVREGALVLNPSLDMDRQVYVAYNARNDVRAQLSTRLRIDENLLLDEVEKAWDAAPPRYIGDPDWPAAGTITDFMWNPTRYEGGTPELRQALDALDGYRTQAIDELRAGYGVDIEARSSAVEGAYYQPTVAFNEERLAALDRTAEQLSGSGRARTRVWDDPYERWQAAKARGEELQFVTDHRMLGDMHAEAMAKMAGDATFKHGTGGLTKAEVVDQVRPGLRQARAEFTNKVANLRARMETAMRQGGVAAKDTRGLAGELTRVERRAQPILERVSDLGQEYGTELSYLSGQLHELGINWRRLRSSLIERGARVGDVQARFAQLLGDYTAAVDELDGLRRAYEAVDTFPYVLNRQTFRYYPADVAGQVDQVLGPPSTNGALRFADSWRNFTLNADASIATIHGSLAAGMDPVTTYKTAGDMLRAARDPQMLERVYQAERDAVEDFVFSTGFDWPGRGVEYTGEFGRTPPLIERIPGFGKKLQAFNEGAWRAVTYRLYQQWKLDRELLQRWNPGLTDEMASSEAATTLWQIVPRMNPARSGRSLARTQLERTFLISPSFLGQPIVTARDALSGMVKIGLDRAYGRGAGLRAATPREQLAMLRLGTLMGTAAAISATSAIASAPANNQSPAEALAEVLDPRSGRFLSVVVGNQGSIALATPFRAVLRALAPRRNENGEWTPFGGLVGYIKGKRAPWLSAAWEQIATEDYFGNPIDEGMFPWELANRAYFLAESALPVAAGEIMGGVRLGDHAGQIAMRTATQLLGQSLYTRKPLEELDRVARSRYDGKRYFELETSQQQALKEDYPGLWRRFVATGKNERRDAEAARDVIRGQQAALDEALLAGQRGKDEWRDQRSKLRENLAGRLDQIYGDSTKPLPKDADALRRWGEQIRLHTGKDGVVDWNAVDAWERQLPQADRDYIERNTGVNDTPVGRVYRKIAAVQDDYYALPKYRGYTAEEAEAIDALWQKARNGARSAEQRDMLRAFGQLSDEERSSKAGQGVRARIRGRLRRTRDRERFTKAHPELQLFFGQGPLSGPQREALTRLVEAETRAAEKEAA